MLLHIFAIISILSIKCSIIATSVEAASGDLDLLVYMQSLGELPEYCKYKIAETKYAPDYVSAYDPKIVNWPPRFRSSLSQWKQRLGNTNWTYVHHYCFGIRETNKYMSMDIDQRKKNNNNQLKRALNEFEFVRRSQAGHTFPFLYELYRYQYFIYFEMGNFQKAQWALNEAAKYRRNN